MYASGVYDFIVGDEHFVPNSLARPRRLQAIHSSMKQYYCGFYGRVVKVGENRGNLKRGGKRNSTNLGLKIGCLIWVILGRAL